MHPIVTSARLLDTYKSRPAGVKAIEPINYMLPLFASERLAGIVGDMISDGHLQGPEKWRLDFTSNSVKDLKRFEKEFLLQFGVKGKVRPCMTNKFGITYNYGINNKPISRVLFLCGIPVGNKVTQEFKIPSWIMSNNLYFKRFIQIVIDCEGSVDTKSKYVELQMSKSEDLLETGFDFFNGIKSKLFKYFKIETTKPFTIKAFNLRKDGIRTKPIKMKIKRKESVIRFYRTIGFENENKMKKLRDVISSWEGN